MKDWGEQGFAQNRGDYTADFRAGGIPLGPLRYPYFPLIEKKMRTKHEDHKGNKGARRRQEYPEFTLGAQRRREEKEPEVRADGCG